jgi:ER-derived vesicles protein
MDALLEAQGWSTVVQSDPSRLAPSVGLEEGPVATGRPRRPWGAPRSWRLARLRAWRAALPSRARAVEWAHARLDDVETHLTKKRRKALLSRAGPVLLVMIFLEDGVRILMRWNEQLHYLTAAMKMHPSLATACLAASSALQLTCSALIVRPQWIRPSRVTPACLALVAYVAVQPFLYGQTADVDFLCRSVTLAGGLLLLLWSENHRRWRATSIGIPLDFQGPNAHRLQLAGRLLLTFIFFFQALWAENGGLHAVLARPTVLGAALVATLFGLSVFISVGFKTEWSALSLVVVFGATNVWMYPFWNVPARLVDFYKYYFFHTLTIMGGLVLLAVHGPGSISLDHLGEKKAL